MAGGHVRGDGALTVRLLLRRTGLAGIAAAVGGALAAIATTRPWYVAIAELSMLGEQQQRRVASLAGVPGTVRGWITVCLGLLAAAFGTNVALDRPHPHARAGMAGTAAVLAALAVTAWLARPSLQRVAGTEGVALLELAERLPTGVELALSVRPGAGPVLVGVAAALIALGALASHDA